MVLFLLLDCSLTIRCACTRYNKIYSSLRIHELIVHIRMCGLYRLNSGQIISLIWGVQKSVEADTQFCSTYQPAVSDNIFGSPKLVEAFHRGFEKHYEANLLSFSLSLVMNYNS